MKDMKKINDFVHILSDEKLKEFSDMPLRARLQWLEEANMFVNKSIGLDKRVLFDKRFEVYLSRKLKKKIKLLLPSR